MTPPTSLPARAYVLSWDRDRDRPSRTWTGYVLRAAALSDLWATGELADRDGRVVLTGRTPPSDPVLRDVWTEIGDAPDRWKHLVARNRSQIEKAVARQLDQAGVIGIEREATRLRRARVEVRNPLTFTRTFDRLGALLRSSERLSDPDAALIGVLSVAGVRTAISKEHSREYADRIARAIAQSGPAVPALRHALHQARSSMS
ncbi:MAG TPA: GPP34 family phosphoprotein [Micromonosporaceae bacterium]|jgi:hypothetical protein